MAAKLFLIPASPATRKFLPTRVIPVRSVCLTYPHIGNVGTNAEDEESAKPYIEGLIVREFSTLASNWRASETAQQYLERHGVPVIWDLDTRALVRHMRQAGALRGVISTDGATRGGVGGCGARAAYDGRAGIGWARDLRQGL